MQYFDSEQESLKTFVNAEVKRAFDSFPTPARKQLMAIRKLIFDTAHATPDVGELSETLKWGEPAYLTEQSRSGTTLRLVWKEKAPSQFGMYFHCQTNLAHTFSTLFPKLFSFDSTRGLVFEVGAPLPTTELRTCIAIALTYHSSKKETRRRRGT